MKHEIRPAFQSVSDVRWLLNVAALPSFAFDWHEVDVGSVILDCRPSSTLLYINVGGGTAKPGGQLFVLGVPLLENL